MARNINVLLLILLVPLVACLDEKFDYGLFEDPINTLSNYKTEQNLLSHLDELRNLLVRRRDAANRVLNELNVPFREGSEEDQAMHPIDTLKAVNRTIHTRFILYRVGSSQIQLSTSAFFADVIEPLEEQLKARPDDYDELEAALKGVITLRETYGKEFVELAARSETELHLGDFYLLAGQSFKMNWFDSAIEFLREVARGNVSYPGSASDRQVLEAELARLKKNAADMNNKRLMKSRKQIGEGFRVMPYMVNETDLSRRRSQPKFVKSLSVPPVRDPDDDEQFMPGEVLEEADRRVCRGDLTGSAIGEQPASARRCRMLHHGDPFLRLGPHKMEVLLGDPFRMIFHDFLSEAETDFLVSYSSPRLSSKRTKYTSNREVRRADAGTKVRIVAKTVQCWIDDVRYNQSNAVHPLDDSGDFHVASPVMLGLTRKIEVATRMQVLGKFSSTRYQTTNYGLGGLCESHIDPHGYVEGRELTPDRGDLVYSGDMLATFMAWLNEVGSGGATAFDAIGYEQRVRPTRGSAAFWIDLDRKGHRERRSSHHGCPVLQGSKWILNKWIFYYDQFRNYPCGLHPGDTYDAFKLYYE